MANSGRSCHSLLPGLILYSAARIGPLRGREGANKSPSQDIDNALASLAVAQLGPVQQFEEVLHWAHPLTSAGGLVIAIVTDHDEPMLRRIAALRQPGGVGLLFLLDSTSFARGRSGPPADETRALDSLVGAAGWSTCIVRSGMTVDRAWGIVSARTDVMLGAGR